LGIKPSLRTLPPILNGCSRSIASMMYELYSPIRVWSSSCASTSSAAGNAYQRLALARLRGLAIRHGRTLTFAVI
jgi:hypothetical protein